MKPRKWTTERTTLRRLLSGPVVTALRVAEDPSATPERSRALAGEVLRAVREEVRRPRIEALWRRRAGRAS